jgi:hypothetical protein
MKQLLFALLGILLLPVSGWAQVFFNSETNSGMIVEMSPGISWYQDQTKSGIITEMFPGVTAFNLTGQNGQPGQTGIAVDLTPRYAPMPDPMVDTLMPPLPKSWSIYDEPPVTFGYEKESLSR